MNIKELNTSLRLMEFKLESLILTLVRICLVITAVHIVSVAVSDETELDLAVPGQQRL
jgi:hypothetical protein